MNLEGAYYTWLKGERVALSEHFSTHEFACPCKNTACLYQRIAKELVDKLELVRVEIGNPIRVTSGYRCSKYQAELRARGYETSLGPSQHEIGRAADITTAPYALKPMAVECADHFKAIGVGKTFVHVDLRADKERRWKYAAR